MPASSNRGSSSPAPPQLPQEIVDLVIDQLAQHGDLRTLQACALTASSWLPRCRSHLFSVVYLHPDNYRHMTTRFRPHRSRPVVGPNSSHSINNPPLSLTPSGGDASPDLGIAQYVRHVYLYAGTHDEDERPIPRDTELQARLLALFPNVEQWDMANVRWAGLRPDVQRFFLAGAYVHLISALCLREVAFPTLGELVRLVGGLRALKVLRLRYVVWEEGGGLGDDRGLVEEGNYIADANALRDHGRGRGRGRGRPSPSANPTASSDAHSTSLPSTGPQLEALEIYECTSPAAFISTLLGFQHSTPTAVWERGSITGERLQRLALDWRGREDDPAVLRNLILDAGAALQILEVDLAWQQPAVPLDLRMNTGLREFYLDGLLLDDAEDSPTSTNPSQQVSLSRCWIPTVLGGISSWRLRKFVCFLILSYLNGLQRLDLERMDDVLSQPQFASVDCVGFSITILPISGVVPPRREEIWEVIKRRMRRVEARGLLKLMRDGEISS